MKSSIIRPMVTAPHPADSFLNGTNSVYMEEMYRLWKADAKSVHPSWDVYFRNIESGLGPGQAFIAPPSIQPNVSPSSAVTPTTLTPSGSDPLLTKIKFMVRAFQVRGHELAQIDPLRLSNPPTVPELDLAAYGIAEEELDTTITIPGFDGVKGFLSESHTTTPRELLKKLNSVYCSTMGVEYMHIQDRAKCNWIRERVEVDAPPLSADQRKYLFDRLAWADKFERFVGRKYNTAKRFGLEGCESMIPGIKAMLDRSTELGVEHAVLGMPHRGRLNVLTNVIRKPLESIFKEFQGTHVDLEKLENQDEGNWSGSGDVKYHLGTSFDRTYPDGRTVHLSLVANPSHLEAVNPVVAGKVRAKQDNMKNVEDPEKHVLGILIHGDAAFAGQGVVYETMQLSQVDDFRTGGIIHVICNNQIGFTTDPWAARSTKYSSDIGKAFECPIFHVNADDPEAVARVFRLAAEWRQEWKTDVLIDLIGYRRHGHNELDEPGFTQPKMYKHVRSHPPVLDLYRTRLIEEGIPSEDLDVIDQTIEQEMNTAFERSHNSPYKEEWLSSRWKGFHSPAQLSRIRDTGVPVDTLVEVGHALTAVPEGFEPHRALKRILKAKADMIETGSGVDWGTAEALAFGTLLKEGNRVRMSGQDVERGTFSHRHAVLHAAGGEASHTPLAAFGQNGSDDKRGPLFTICNSPLSEFGVMGFEVGYSLEDPNQLVLWEAQFGDFVNGAQVIIDQFLTSGEQKWKRQCGLVLLLPHGYDGQGPEHSSCRLERFLQASDDDENDVPEMDADARRQIQLNNVQVVNCSTPANYFHVLRRQVHRDFRKPLIVASPKSLLRHRSCVSTLQDMAEDTKFQRFIPESGEQLTTPDQVRRLVLCSGKLYYDLHRARDEAGIRDVAIARVEQIAPFPFDCVAKEVERFGNAEIVWAQEEPRNMGAWSYVAPRIVTATRELNSLAKHATYVGRQPAASPAVGVASVHEREQKQVITQALST